MVGVNQQSFAYTTLKLTGAARSGHVTEQSFALQYTALILIILTFLVGAFIRPHLPGVPSSADPVTPKIEDFGTLEYTNLFDGDQLNAEIVAALITFVTSHDVQLKIVVNAPVAPALDADTRMATSLSRSVALTRHFIDRGVPPIALDILATQTPSTIQARVAIRAQPVLEDVE